MNSTYGKTNRKFLFKERFDGVSEVSEFTEKQKNETSLIFKGFSKSKINSYDYLKPEALKNMIKEQYLPTLDRFRREEKSFEILINLTTQDENQQKEFFNNSITITEKDLPLFEKITINDATFDGMTSVDMLYHIEEVSEKGHCLMAFNVDGRTIPTSLIPQSAFPIGYNCIFLFESELFHSNADSSRQKLVLPEGHDENTLYKILRYELGIVLEKHIPKIKERNKKTKEIFEEKFPHLLGYFETETVGLIDQDEALSIAQQKFFVAEKEVLQCEELNDRTYEKSLELSSRVLTEYILYREKIIRRMKSMTYENAETEIHNLILPRYKEFNGSDVSEVYQNNAWLLDDKFMVFRTILSEKKMDKVIQAIRLDDELVDDDGRPDIAMIFSADPYEYEQVDVVIVEIKRKTDDEKENQYAINQLLDRALKLVTHCTNIQRVWYYALMNVNKTMATRLQQYKWTPLFSKGSVFYQELSTPHPNGRDFVPTPTFVMSFDAIVGDAENRNRTFLEILREGMKKYEKSI